ncbi:MAG: prolyl oligopeptidase family serine peptidase [Chitinophagaceae bacterium]|nr:prolyl oligopeptidase family serine peptidase [Chitinophagaceae bacterium]
MNKILIYVVTSLNFLIFLNAAAQSKKNIDLDALDHWPGISSPRLTADGKYASFLIGKDDKSNKVILLTATDKSWTEKISIEDTAYGSLVFTTDSKYAVFRTEDSLHILRLGTSDKKIIPGISWFEAYEPDLPFLVFTLKGIPAVTVFYDIDNNQQLLRVPLNHWITSPDHSKLIYSIAEGSGERLYWYDCKNKLNKMIWSGKQITIMKFDKTGNQLAFIASGGTGKKPSIFLFRVTDTMAKEILAHGTIPLKGEFEFSDIERFSQNGTRLFCKVKADPPARHPSPQMASVDIWNFNDPVLQSMQQPAADPNEYAAVLDLTSGKMNMQGCTRDLWRDIVNEFSDDWRLFAINGYDNGEGYWNRYSNFKVIAVNNTNGEERVLTNDGDRFASSFNFSPDGRYVLYFDWVCGNYFSYELSTGQKKNLTGRIRDDFSAPDNFRIIPFWSGGGERMAGWIKTGDSFHALLKARKGIWRISLDGNFEPVCINKQEGKQQPLRFKKPDIFLENSSPEATVFEDGKPIIMCAFDPAIKENGFYLIDPTGKSAPQQLFMGNYVFQLIGPTFHSWGHKQIVKARNADIFLVCRQSSTISENYFVTKDFKTFQEITDLHPEKGYNWLSTELVNWTLPNGKVSQGILYKPEDFDPSKKYPIIFHYYELMSDFLNLYMPPERSTCVINIPYYVSNGYLVFTPDILPTNAGAGWDALNTMVSAANYLTRKYPFIDAKRMGLSGHSMGGYKTNFIITHSTLFAAAEGHAGTANVSSWSLNLWNNGGSQSHTEIGQYYLGHSIAERPDLYVSNSPVFYVSKIQTPLLMMYNKLDKGPWEEGVAMFKAMRRAGKRAWMLQYDGNGHALNSGDTLATKDYTIRQRQFFDHYLMGKPAPVWMTRGIPLNRKGLDDGLELDEHIRTPVGTLLSGDARERQWQLGMQGDSLLKRSLSTQ